MSSMVARVSHAVRRTPGVRRAAPSLSTVWRAAGRSQLNYASRRLATQLRTGRVADFPLTVAFVPEAPRPLHAAYGFCLRLGIRRVPMDRADVIIHWHDTTVRASADRFPPTAINVACSDISKRRVDAIHQAAFGYGLAPEPGAPYIVEKSDLNARHDGAVLAEPSRRADRVVQRLVDNAFSPDLVTDLRVTVVGQRIATVITRYRPVWDRFGAHDSEVLAVLHDPGDLLSAEEQARLLLFCRLAGADYADLDALRDRSGLLFVVDLNTTPSAATGHLSRVQRHRYWAAIEPAWARLLYDHVVAGEPG